VAPVVGVPVVGAPVVVVLPVVVVSVPVVVGGVVVDTVGNVETVSTVLGKSFVLFDLDVIKTVKVAYLVRDPGLDGFSTAPSVPIDVFGVPDGTGTMTPVTLVAAHAICSV